MATMRDVLTLAKAPLNEEDEGFPEGARYTDTTLLSFAIHGLLDLYRERSDLFVGQMLSPPSLSMTLDSTFPLSDGYIQPLADWVTYRSEMSDDENVSGGRAIAFSQFYGRNA